MPRPLERGQIAALALCCVLAGCSSLHLQDAGRTGPLDILTAGVTAARTNAVARSIDVPLREDWSYNAGGGFGPYGPLVYGKYVIVGTRTGEVHVVSSDRGKKVGSRSFGDAVNGSPEIRGSVMYVPSAWGRKRSVAAYDLATGAIKWTYGKMPVEASLLLAADIVVFVDASSTVRALTVRRGEPVWSRTLDRDAWVRSSPVLVDGHTVVVADDRGRVYGLDLATGTEHWRANIGGAVVETPASGAGAVFVSTTRGRLYALDSKNGAIHWIENASDSRVRFTSAAVSDDVIVVGASDGTVRSLNSEDGTTNWTWHGDGVIAGAAVIAGDKVFFGSMSRMAYALDLRSGALLWSHEVRGRIKSAPAVGHNAVYFLSEPRYLYRFVPEEEDYATTE